jgi:probable rRNA maturation factor
MPVEAAGVEVDVEIEDPAWAAHLPDVETLVVAAATAALSPTRTGTVTVLLTDDEAVADLNGRFRGREGPTNVLSFPAAASARPHLGDLALALGICEAEARAQGKPLAHHLQHLVAHGVLHLVGFDHQSDEEAEVMEARERQVLASLGIADPYAVPDDPVPVRPEH